ncbi:MAG: DegT/DnrJ/EryC1/StrS family aminotransferase [Planctomycetaceae bacterium]|jgi:dTDP-4-amino-4,6-dideoxygalactose transaminase
MSSTLPLCHAHWPAWPIHDESEENALLEVLRSGKWWFGEKVARFETEYAAFQGAKYAVTCTNGTTAIEMALRALGVVEGDEVIVPCYSFIATASAVVTIGAIPVFADICPDTLCIDPGDVEAKITDKTRAIIPVHVSGLIADMERLNAIADQHGLEVLEDAAHAWGSQVDGKGAGTLGRAGTFSFQETKNITAGEGGVLVTNDAEIADLCRSFTHCGRAPGSAWYDHDFLGSNLRLTEFQAVILSVQLERLEQQVATRERNVRLINDILGDVSCIQLPAESPRMTRRSYHMYIFRLKEDLRELRDVIVAEVAAAGVPVSAGWYRPLYRNDVFQKAHLGPAHGIRSPLAGKGVDYTSTNCPVCEQVCQDAIWIPQYVLLGSESDVISAARVIRHVIEQKKNG